MSWDLAADIGGTNSRFGRVRDGVLDEIAVYPTDGPDGALGAMRTYAAAHAGPPGAVVAAVAGPVDEVCATITNSNQTIMAADVRRVIGAVDVALINDFEAAAYAHAEIVGDNLLTLQGPRDCPPGTRLVIGPGTGLGVGLLIEGPAGYVALPSEGGHVGVSPMNERQLDVFRAYADFWPEVRIGDGSLRFEAEAVLSGRGLPHLYRAAAAAAAQVACAATTAEILEAAKSGADPAAEMTLEIFRSQLGALAGDLSLALSALGGVYLFGGVVARNPWLLDQTFLNAFNEGGRFSALRRRIPVYLNTDGMAGLKGAAYALRSRFRAPPPTA